MRKPRIDFTLGAEPDACTIDDLLFEFYHHHTVKQKELYKKYRGKNFVHRPIRILRDPKGWGSDSVLPTPLYIVVYYRHFYVRVECGKSFLTGPHKLELCYFVRKGCHILLGTWQTEFPFANELKLRKKLKKAIQFKKYFASEKLRETVIELGEDTSADEVSI